MPTNILFRVHLSIYNFNMHSDVVHITRTIDVDFYYKILMHIFHLLYFHNRARWAIIVIICPFRGTREI